MGKCFWGPCFGINLFCSPTNLWHQPTNPWHPQNPFPSLGVGTTDGQDSRTAGAWVYPWGFGVGTFSNGDVMVSCLGLEVVVLAHMQIK